MEYKCKKSLAFSLIVCKNSGHIWFNRKSGDQNVMTAFCFKPPGPEPLPVKDIQLLKAALMGGFFCF